MDSKSKNELSIFKKFAEVCPYDIDFDSIEKRQPPEPDILCRLSDGKKIAFELVESVDKSLYKTTCDSSNLIRALYDRIENLPKLEKQLIKTKFGDIQIIIFFHKKLTFIKKQNAIEMIFKQLFLKENLEKIAKMRQSSSQEFDLELPKNLRDFVKRITFIFTAGPSGGPYFDIPEAVWFSDPIKNNIYKKLNKAYKTNYHVELLVYYELQPEIAPERQILPATDSIVEKIKKSIFKRVWLYSVTQNKVIYVFPNLTPDYNTISKTDNN